MCANSQSLNVCEPELRNTAIDEFPQPSLPATARVIHVINGEHYSGAERVQDLLAERLPSEGFDVALACVKPGRFANDRVSRKTPLFNVPMRHKFDIRAAWKLARIVQQQDYHLIHAHTPRTAMIGRLAALRCGVPLVYHVHSPTARDSTRKLANWLNSTTETWSVRGAARLIAVSSSLGNYLRTLGFAEHLISVVPNGVPINGTDDPIESAGGQAVQGPAIEAGWTLGTVALFRPRKGTEVLLDALAVLYHEHGLNVSLRAVGPFENEQYESELKRRVDRLGIEEQVHWTGFTRDVRAELAQMDLFVLPSLFGEGLPMVVLEAMAAGVPVVGTRVEGVPEAIRDGQDGVIAEPGDANDLARCIEQFVDGTLNWTDIRQSAIERQAERFSDRSMAAGVAQVYREILQTNQAANQNAIDSR